MTGLALSSSVKLRSSNCHARGLGVGIALAVVEVGTGDGGEMLVLDAVTLVVLVDQLVEHVRPHEPRLTAFVTDPGCGTEVLCGEVPRHVPLLLGADDEHGVVATGFDLGHRREDHDAPRSARRLVASGRDPPQLGAHRCRHRTELTLSGEQLAEGVPDVDGADVGGVDVRRGECRVDDVGDQVGDLLALTRVVAGEVGLITPEHEDLLHAPLLLLSCYNSNSYSREVRVFPDDLAAARLAAGWWDGSTWDSRMRLSVTRRADRTALVDPPNRASITDGEPRTLTWREVDAATDRLAAQLLAAGVAAGDAVGIQLPNVAELPVTYLAVARIGAVAVPFPVQYREHELVELVPHAEITAFVTAASILGRPNAEAIVALGPHLPTLRRVLAFGQDVPPGAIAVDGGAAEPSEADRLRLAEHVAAYVIDPNDAATICWTSGTESTPKGVPRSHGDWSAMWWTTIESASVSADDVLLCTFPLVNAGGLGGMFGPWISQGCTLVMHQPFDVTVFLEQIAEQRVTYTVSPPAVLTRLLLAPELLGSFDLTSLPRSGVGRLRSRRS